MLRFSVLFICMFFMACNSRSKSEVEQSAQEIIDKSIEVSGGELFKHSRIGFYFRDTYYTADRNAGDFSLSRISVKNGDSIIDILSNEGFSRFINNKFIKLTDSLGQLYSSSVNSVHYFSVLPYGLKRSCGEQEIHRV
jgi:hypothetical protein